MVSEEDVISYLKKYPQKIGDIGKKVGFMPLNLEALTPISQNLSYVKKGSALCLLVHDVEHEIGESSSGKSIKIASNGNSRKVFTFNPILQISFNLYKTKRDLELEEKEEKKELKPVDIKF